MGLSSARCINRGHLYGMKDEAQYTLENRELSWLAFNGRVLQEAEDLSVPLFERLKFLAIYSSNLDEFFRVRVASLRSLLRLKKKSLAKLDFHPARLLKKIHRIVNAQQTRFGQIFQHQILPALEAEGIRLVDESALTKEQAAFAQTYFENKVAGLLEASILKANTKAPFLRNRELYLVTELWPDDDTSDFIALEHTYGLLTIPCPPLPRFVELPSGQGQHAMIFLDDLIRFNLAKVYPGYELGATYAVKLSRDADLYVEDEFEGDLVEKIKKALGKRETGLPTRFLYDYNASYAVIAFLQGYFNLEVEDIVAGGRYHNFSDFFGFPTFDRNDLTNTPLPPLPHPTLEGEPDLFAAMRTRDHLVHVPYQKFDYVIRFLEDAAVDPDVESIWMTLYRVAKDSAVARALIQAAEAGKQVTAFVEVKARFDEAPNIEWAERMEQAGVQVLYSMPKLKVHSKLAMVARREGGKERLYAYLGTGNFNEKTARIYTDVGLLTANKRLTKELKKVFAFLLEREGTPTFKHLLVAPFIMRKRFNALVDYEIEQAQAGNEAWMILKMNSLEDDKMIHRLYEASNAGVKVQLIVRGICCLVPGVPGQSENIQVVSIVDRFLEHWRGYVFCHGGDPQYYLASADWMRRNLSRRIEVGFPICDPELQQQIRALLDMQLRDNQKARRIESELRNDYVVSSNGQAIRAQTATYAYFEEQAQPARALKVTGSRSQGVS